MCAALQAFDTLKADEMKWKDLGKLSLESHARQYWPRAGCADEPSRLQLSWPRNSNL